MKTFFRIVGGFLAVVLCISSLAWMKNLLENWHESNDATRKDDKTYTVSPGDVDTGTKTLGQTVVYSNANRSGLGTADLSSYLKTGKHYEVYAVSYIADNCDSDITERFSFDWDGTAKTPEGTGKIFGISDAGMLSVTTSEKYSGMDGEIEYSLSGVLVLEGTPSPMPYKLVSENVPECTKVKGLMDISLSNGFLFVKVLLYNKSTGSYTEDYFMSINNSGTYVITSVCDLLTYTVNELCVKDETNYRIVGLYMLYVPVGG